MEPTFKILIFIWTVPWLASSHSISTDDTLTKNELKELLALFDHKKSPQSSPSKSEKLAKSPISILNPQIQEISRREDTASPAELLQQLELINKLLGAQNPNNNANNAQQLSFLDTLSQFQTNAPSQPQPIKIEEVKNPPITVQQPKNPPITIQPAQNHSPIKIESSNNDEAQQLQLLLSLLSSAENGNSPSQPQPITIQQPRNPPITTQSAQNYPPIKIENSNNDEAQQLQLLLSLLSSGENGGPKNERDTQNFNGFKNTQSSMDAASSSQLSSLIGILGALGSVTGGNSLLGGNSFLGQNNQKVFQNQQQQASLLSSLLGGGNGNLFLGAQQKNPSVISSLGTLGSSVFSALGSSLSGLKGSLPDGRPRVRGLDTRLGLGYRLGQNMDAQLMWEVGPQLFTEPLENEKKHSADPRQNLREIRDEKNQPTAEEIQKHLEKILQNEQKAQRRQHEEMEHQKLGQLFNISPLSQNSPYLTKNAEQAKVATFQNSLREINNFKNTVERLSAYRNLPIAQPQQKINFHQTPSFMPQKFNSFNVPSDNGPQMRYDTEPVKNENKPKIERKTSDVSVPIPQTSLLPPVPLMNFIPPQKNPLNSRSIINQNMQHKNIQMSNTHQNQMARNNMRMSQNLPVSRSPKISNDKMLLTSYEKWLMSQSQKSNKRPPRDTTARSLENSNFSSNKNNKLIQNYQNSQNSFSSRAGFFHEPRNLNRAQQRRMSNNFGYQQRMDYNPHQNFLPESEDSFLRRNAMPSQSISYKNDENGQNVQNMQNVQTSAKNSPLRRTASIGEWSGVRPAVRGIFKNVISDPVTRLFSSSPVLDDHLDGDYNPTSEAPLIATPTPTPVPSFYDHLGRKKPVKPTPPPKNETKVQEKSKNAEEIDEDENTFIHIGEDLEYADLVKSMDLKTRPLVREYAGKRHKKQKNRKTKKQKIIEDEDEFKNEKRPLLRPIRPRLPLPPPPPHLRLKKIPPPIVPPKRFPNGLGEDDFYESDEEGDYDDDDNEDENEEEDDEDDSEESSKKTTDRPLELPGMEMFIDIDNGELSVRKPIGNLDDFGPTTPPPKTDDELEDEESFNIYERLQEHFLESAKKAKMKEEILKATEEHKKKIKLEKDDSLGMVNRYFDLLEDDDPEKELEPGFIENEPDD